MNSFWHKINKPIFTLAPMEDVTDTVFREIVLSVSNPEFIHVLFTEFTSTDGLCHPIGRPKVSTRLHINNSERELLKKMGVKLVAQIWGSEPENFYKATKIICEEYDFDGIDINMGCPVKKIVKQASCSELIKFPELAKEIVIATKEASNLPVSVKTRTGIKTHNTEEWISTLLEVDPEVITLHCRTQKMMSDFPAEWDEVRKAVNVRNEKSPDVLILGNGDLASVDDCMEKVKSTGADGVMIGRGIFANPWFFNKEHSTKSANEKLELLWKHVDLFGNTWKGEKNFAINKRFFKVYTNGFPGAAELRGKLMEINTKDEVWQILQEFKNKFIVEG